MLKDAVHKNHLHRSRNMIRVRPALVDLKQAALFFVSTGTRAAHFMACWPACSSHKGYLTDSAGKPTLRSKRAALFPETNSPRHWTIPRVFMHVGLVGRPQSLLLQPGRPSHLVAGPVAPLETTFSPHCARTVQLELSRTGHPHEAVVLGTAAPCVHHCAFVCVSSSKS